MKIVTIFLAFVLGCLLPLIVWRGTSLVSAQDDGGPVHACVAQNGAIRVVPLTAACPADQQSVLLQKPDATVDVDQGKGKKKNNDELSSADKAILNDLDSRLHKMEAMDCSSIGKNKVVAPFEVVDRDGKRVFYVDNNAAGLFNSSGQAVAKAIADPQGGLFTVETGNTMSLFGISDTVTGFGIKENSKLRVDLGKNSRLRNYRLIFKSASGNPVAAIGISPDNNGGLATVGDQSGATKATLGLSKNGAGLIEILGLKTVAQMTESELHHGGRLWLGNVDGLGMVEAGDAGGYGMVRVGPKGFEFIPTPGLALPGSVIIGKR
jgi:hypothetical protein